MTELTIAFADYSLTLDQLQLLSEDCLGKPLTEEADHTITFGFEDAAHAKAFQHCLLCHRNPSSP